MTHAAFVAALLDPQAALPQGLVDPQGRPAPKRFSIYRNNVVSGLSRALEQAFPVVRALVGAEFFAAMASVFVRAHPPTSPILMLYGVEFPAFLAAFSPVAALPYLPDVARLEQALRASYHAPDATPDPALAHLTPHDLMGARLQLSPTLHLLRSNWPIHAIWCANTAPGAAAPVVRPEDVLILRAAFDPVPHLLHKGAADFIAALQSGARLLEAAAAAGPDHDLAATIALLLSGGGLVCLQKDIA